MGRLKILAKEGCPRTGSKLLEKLIFEVLGRYGYRPNRTLRISDAGLDIEMEGKHSASGSPFYAECSYRETAVTALELQAFYGRYMTRWHQNNECHGLFAALPGIDNAARKFYQEHLEKNPQVTFRLYEEKQILKALTDTLDVVRPDTIARRIARKTGTPGDCFLLFTEKGFFWAQHVIGHGSGAARRIAIFDPKGNVLADTPILDYLTRLYPELGDDDSIAVSSPTARQPGLFQDAGEIIEMQAGSECFEHRLPAAPRHFVGRRSYLEELDAFATNVVGRKTSCRGIVFAAPPGGGKSSLALAWIDRLRAKGHLAISIDTRSVSSPRSILRVANLVFRRFEDFCGQLQFAGDARPFARFEDAAEALLQIGQALEGNGKLMIIVFDQFEHVFSQPDIIQRLQDLLQKISDAQTNAVLGFAWNMDPVGLSAPWPDDPEKIITSFSKHISLDIFTAKESDELIDKLSEEIRQPVKKDLRFHLAEFSQGYPWLLKILCRRVIDLRQAGVPQSDIPRRLLSVNALFQEDVDRLPPETAATLRRIARAAPIRMLESSQHYDSEAVQGLIHQGHVIRIGNTYDVYGEIFKDFLTGRGAPVKDRFLLLAKIDQVLWATKILQKSNGVLGASKLKAHAALSATSFYRVIRDLNLLGLAKTDNDAIILEVRFPETTKDFEVSWRRHLRSRLQSNRQVLNLLTALKNNNSLTIADVSGILETLCAYMSAPRQAWLTYARILAQWMDAADLALLDSRNRKLIHYDAETEIREHHLLLPKRHGTRTPQIQYAPVESVAARLVQALRSDGSVDWKGFKKNTILRALATLEDLGFIQRKARLIKVLPEGLEFGSHPEKRPRLFARAALQLASFAAFMEILNARKNKSATLLALGLELRNKLGANWKQSTATTVAKIMLDWARNSQLAPGVFARARRGPIKGWKKKKDTQMPLFSERHK
ncbi:MAG: hypothetical protein ABIK98_15415 [Pseudomonadota bacterium]